MKTVLIVDDSSFMRNIIKKHLDELDVTIVGEAGDGKEAVDKYKELNPDIVTLDLAMLDNDGIEALRVIREHDPNADVIIISSTTDQVTIVDQVTSLGACAIINKPIVKNELIGVFNDLLSK